MNLRHRALLRLVVISTAFTGFSGLVFEVCWQRYLANLIGSEAKSTSLVLAVFLGGLALGYRLFGHLSLHRTSASLLRLCGLAELGIGAWALVTPTLYSLLWNHVGVVDPQSSWTLVAELAVSLLFVGPPTILMGCTLPLLTKAIAENAKSLTDTHARVYSINTFGAFAGSLIASFALLPAYGLTATMMGVSLINIAAGILLIVQASKLTAAAPLESKTRSNALQQVNPKITETTDLPSSVTALLSCTVGFIGLGLQTILVRVAGLAMGASEYTFAMMVAMVILMIAIGAAALRSERFGKRITLTGNQLAVAFGLAWIYLLIPFLPYLILLMRTLFPSTAVAFYAYYGACFLFLSLLLAVPLLPMGCSMPLLFARAQSELQDAGLRVGRLYSWNAVGCVLGTLVGSHLALYYFNLDVALKIYLVLAAFVYGVLMLASSKQRAQNWKAATVAIIGALAFALAAPSWDARALGLGLFRATQGSAAIYSGRSAALDEVWGNTSVLDRRDDPFSSVSIGETWLRNSPNSTYFRTIIVNGKSDGATGGPDLDTTRLLAHLPALLGGLSESRVAVIGFGTGITAGALALHPEIKAIETIEISTGVRDFAYYFASSNGNVTENPKFKWQMADAYRFLSSQKGRFGLIVSEPSNPWVSGVERLFSEEFYRRALESLEDGGIFAQWFHYYSTSPEAVSLVAKTLSGVFPHVRLFISPVAGDLILLGSAQPVGAEAIARAKIRLDSNSQVRTELAQLGYNSLLELFVNEAPIAWEAFQDDPVHTLTFPRLSFQAGKDFFIGQNRAIEKFMVSDLQQLWRGASESRRLIRVFLDTISLHWDFPARLAATKLAMAYACKGQLGVGSAPFQWETLSRECRTSHFSLLLGGHLPPQGEMTSEDMDLIRWLTEAQAAPHTNRHVFTPEQAEAVIHWFAIFDSAYLPFSVDRLITVADVCLNDPGASHCRYSLVRILAFRGYSEAANRVFDEYERRNYPEVPNLRPFVSLAVQVGNSARIKK